MAEGEKPIPLEDLDERLRAARHRRNGAAIGEPSKRRREQGGLGAALRIGVDLVAAVGVGVGIGLLLDYWLESKPWFLIVFFLLGAAAGIVNVMRVASGYGLAAGFKKPGAEGAKDKD